MDKNSLNKQSKGNENTSFLIPKVNEIAISAGIICFYPEDHYKMIYANDFLVSELGYHDSVELQYNTGFSFLALIHPDELEGFKKYTKRLFTGKESFRCRFRCKNYGYKWFEVSGAYETDVGGRDYIFCTCIPISKYVDLEKKQEEMHAEIEKVKLQMKASVGNFPCGLLIFNLGDKKELCYASDSFCLMCGYTRNEIEHQYCNQYISLVYEKDQVFFEKALYELAEYPHQKNLEYRIKTKAGDVIWVLDSIKSVRDAQGNMWAYAAVIDVSKWQKPWSVFSDVIEDLPFGTVICDYYEDQKLFKVQFCNDYMKKYLGDLQDFSEMITPDQLRSMVLPQDLEKINHALKQLHFDDAQAELEFRIQRNFFPTLISMKIRTRKIKENIISIHAVFFEICEDKSSESNMAVLNGYLEKFQQVLPFAIMVKELDSEKKPIYISPNMKTFFRNFVSKNHMTDSDSYKQAVYPDDYRNLKRIYQQHQKNLPSDFENEFRLEGEDGNFIWIQEKAKRLEGFSAPDVYLSVFTDITQLKNAEYKLHVRGKENRMIAQKNNDIVGWFHFHDDTISFLDQHATGYPIFEDQEKIIDFGDKIGYVQEESLKEYIGFYEKIKRHEPADAEIKVKSQDNDEKWFFCTYDLIFGQNGNVVSAMIYFSDITEKKLREFEIQKLKERERILEIMAEDSQKIILKFNFHTMCYEPLNSIAKKRFKDIQVYSAEKLLSTEYVAEESIETAHKFYEDMCRGKKTGTMNFKVKRLGGGYRWYQSTFTNVFIDRDVPAYAIIFCEDITEKREHELASLRFSDYTKIGSRKIFLNLEYNVTKDSFEKCDGTIPSRYMAAFMTSYTKAYQRMLDDVLPVDKDDFIASFSRENILKNTKEGTDHATKEILINYNNQPTWIRVFYQTMKDPYTSFINIWITCTNINEEKQYELKLLEMAKIDKLTGIYNRAAFMDWVGDKCKMVNENEKRFLIMLDVDGFGKVNDRFGHNYGDTILKKIAQTLKLVTGNEDILARLGGDEFAIFTGGFSDIDIAKEKLRIIVASMYRELKWGVKISISAGVSTFPADGNCFQALYERADIALHYAKLTGRNKYIIYDSTMEDIDLSCSEPSENEEYMVTKGIYIRTFGYFEVFVNGEALLIENAKAKELLAILVDRRGAYVSQADLISCLWEDEPVNKVTMARLRKAVMHLRNALKTYNIEELIESKRGLRRLNTGIVNCDLYNFLSGKPEYSNLFKGSYMLNYSWGELMISELETQINAGQP